MLANFPKLPIDDIKYCLCLINRRRGTTETKQYFCGSLQKKGKLIALSSAPSRSRCIVECESTAAPWWQDYFVWHLCGFSINSLTLCVFDNLCLGLQKVSTRVSFSLLFVFLFSVAVSSHSTSIRIEADADAIKITPKATISTQTLISNEHVKSFSANWFLMGKNVDVKMELFSAIFQFIV